MPAGKLAVTGGFAWAKPLHFGVNIRAMRRHSKPKTAALLVDDLREYRKALRSAFRKYLIACENYAPTATQRRQALNKIKTAARRLSKDRSRSSAGELLTALDPPLDRGVIGVAYGQLSKKGYEPLPFKKRLLHWTGISPFPEDCLPALTALAALDVEALVPKKGLFPDPALANAVAVLVPIWKKVTGRTAGPISADRVGDQKKYPFADWLAEMHDLLGVAQPPVGRVLDIVRGLETQKNPAPVTTVKDGNN